MKFELRKFPVADVWYATFLCKALPVVAKPCANTIKFPERTSVLRKEAFPSPSSHAVSVGDELKSVTFVERVQKP